MRYAHRSLLPILMALAAAGCARQQTVYYNPTTGQPLPAYAQADSGGRGLFTSPAAPARQPVVYRSAAPQPPQTYAYRPASAYAAADPPQQQAYSDAARYRWY